MKRWQIVLALGVTLFCMTLAFVGRPAFGQERDTRDTQAGMAAASVHDAGARGTAKSASDQADTILHAPDLARLPVLTVSPGEKLSQTGDVPGWNVELVGQIGGVCRAAQVVGNYAYIGEGSNLRILDVSNASLPVPCGRILLPDIVSSVFVSGGFAYIVSGGSLAYIAESRGRLQIVDVTSPSLPQLRGSCDMPSAGTPSALTPGYTYWQERHLGVYVSGGLAYVAEGRAGLQIIDVTNPSSPQLRGSYDTPGYTHGIWISGGLGYVADGEGGLQIIDVTNPLSPQLRGSYDTPGYATGVYVSGGIAYVADGPAGLQIIDVTNPASPQFRGTYDTPGFANGVYVSSGLVYVADGYSGLQIMDVTNPALPQLRGAYDTPGFASGVCVSSGFAYVADMGRGLQIIDITNPSLPQFRSSYGTAGYTYGVYVSSGAAYVADWDLQIMDVTNPSLPQLRGSCHTPSDLSDDVGYHQGNDLAVYVSGGLAYLADGYSGLQIIDVTSPSSPQLRGSYDTPGYAHGIYVSGNLAYVADEGSGLQIIDVTNPSSPQLRGSYNTPGYAWSAHVSGGLAYVADWERGLQIIDVTNASWPQLRGSDGTPGYAWGVYVSGGLAYLADGEAGLQIIDVTNPSAPQFRGSYNTPGYAHGIYVSGGLAYVGDGEAGLQVIDVTNPSSPQLRGSYDTPGYAMDVYVSGALAYVADGEGGVWILRYKGYHAPQMPANVLPTSGSAGLSLTPTLTSSAFQDTVSTHTHAASQWQISTAGDFTTSPPLLWDSDRTPSSLTSIAVPAGLLRSNTTYYWRVRHQDNMGAWSSWSQETWFQTTVVATISMPQGLRASPGARSVRLTWSPNSDPDLAGYNLYRDTSSGGSFTTKVNPTLIIGTEYLDDNLSTGTTYWYKITAQASDGRVSPKSTAVSAVPGTTRITMPDVRGLAGSTVTLLVNLDNANGVTGNGMDIRVSYNRNILTPVAFHKTPLTESFTFASNIGFANGQVNFSGISAIGAQVRGEGRILTVDFVVAPGTAAWTTSTLAFVQVFLYDAAANPITVDYTDTALFTCAADYILGDLNGDGVVTSADALIAQRIAMGEIVPTPLQQMAGDVNGDGFIDAADVTLILRLAVGLPLSGSPAPEPSPGRAPRKLAGTSYLVSIGHVQGAPGQTVAVPVTISNAVALAGCDLHISYDPTKLIFDSAAKAPLTQSNFTLQARNLVGQVRLTASAPSDLPSGGGQLFILSFRIPADARWSVTPLTVAKIKLSGELGENLDWQNTISVSNGSVSTGIPTRARPSWNLLR